MKKIEDNGLVRFYWPSEHAQINLQNFYLLPLFKMYLLDIYLFNLIAIF